MNKPTIIFILFFLSLGVLGQEQYEGVVYDVGTRKVVGDVIIKSSTVGIATLVKNRTSDF